MFFTIFIVFIGCCMYYALSLNDPTGLHKMSQIKINTPKGLVIVNTYEQAIYANSVITTNNGPCILGHTHILQEIDRIIEQWDPHLSDKSPLHDAPTGILLYGPPGTGKTTLARQLCNRIPNATLLHVSPDILENKYQGESFKLMKAVFTLAKKLTPCIVFFDEIDGFMSKRSEMDQSHTNTMKTLFLCGLDSLKNKHVLVIGATNRPECLDAALMRRLEIHFLMDKPSNKDKCEYIESLIGAGDYDDLVSNTLPSNISLHGILTFLKFCTRRNDLKDLTTLYDEYNRTYKFYKRDGAT